MRVSWGVGGGTSSYFAKATKGTAAVFDGRPMAAGAGCLVDGGWARNYEWRNPPSHEGGHGRNGGWFGDWRSLGKRGLGSGENENENENERGGGAESVFL